MYQPAVAAQKVDLVDEHVAVPAEFYGDRFGFLFSCPGAQEREGVSEAVRDDFFVRFRGIEAGALRHRPVDLFCRDAASGGNREGQEREPQETHVANLLRRG